MHKLIALAILAVAASTFGTDRASAADKATTKQLPAALKALGATEADIVTTAEAETVRGQGLYIDFEGILLTNFFRGPIVVRGCVNYFNIYADPNHFQIIAR